MQCLNLLVGIGGILHLLDKPGIAEGIGIGHRHGASSLCGHDEPAGVEHVQHGELSGLYAVHLSACAYHLLHDTAHLGGNVFLNHLLVAA